MSSVTSSLPEEFMFGTSSAAHQIEGGLTNNWTRWCQKRGKECSGQAIRHYQNYEKDYSIAQSLNHDIHRLSVAWSRVMPEKGEIDEDEIEHYRNRVQALRDRGIEPMVTLWHFSHPDWFAEAGGWESGPIGEFQTFVKEVVDALGDDVSYWVTLNEPQGFAWLAYGSDWWPPERNSVVAYLRAERNFVRAHNKSSRYIRENLENAQVGIAASQLSLVPKRPVIGNILTRLADKFKERRFIDKTDSNTLDFLGVNYYFHREIGLDGVSTPETTDEKQPPYPSMIGDVLEDAWETHNLPLFVTETGTADDGKRSWYLKESVQSVNDAVERGVPVHGYLYWTLFDCYEWHSGWSMDFGLVSTQKNSKERRIRDAGETFARIAAREL